MSVEFQRCCKCDCPDFLCIKPYYVNALCYCERCVPPDVVEYYLKEEEELKRQVEKDAEDYKNTMKKHQQKHEFW